MDNTDILLDLIEHPENYSEQEVQKILADPRSRDLYKFLSYAASEVSVPESCTASEIDHAWNDFKRMRARRRRFRWSPRKWVAACCLLLALGAVGAITGIALRDREADSRKPAVDISLVSEKDVAGSVDTSQESVGLPVESGERVFDNVTLREIMKEISLCYGVDIVFKSPSTGKLRLHFEWNPAQSLPEVLENLNSFEQINITFSDNTLTID